MRNNLQDGDELVPVVRGLLQLLSSCTVATGGDGVYLIHWALERTHSMGLPDHEGVACW